MNRLITKKNGIYFDGTVGFGGHAAEFLKLLDSDAAYVGTDVDEDAFVFSQKKFENDERFNLYKYNFSFIYCRPMALNTTYFYTP